MKKKAIILKLNTLGKLCIVSILGLLVGFAVIMTGCATKEYHISDMNKEITDKIFKEGTGSRHVIPNFGPAKRGGIKGTYSMEGGASGMNVIGAPYAGQIRIGDGSVIRFLGKVEYSGFIINSNESNPLEYLTTNKYGWVYLHGSGYVIDRNGKKVNVP